MGSNQPIIDQRLIDYLDLLYPDRCPDVLDPERSIWMDAGSVRVVRHLKQLLKEQEENLLERSNVSTV